MALLKRYLVYTAIVAVLLFFFYQLHFPSPALRSQPIDIKPNEPGQEPLPESSPPDQPADEHVPHVVPTPVNPTGLRPAPGRPALAKPAPAKPDGGKEHKKPASGSPSPAFNWADLPFRNKIQSVKSLPTGTPLPLPKIQARFPTEKSTDRALRESRQAEVKKAFARCWKSYKANAWLKDELKPITGGSKSPFGGWAATLIDSLDTLWMMDMKDEFTAAIEDVVEIDLGTTTLDQVNVFETNIRHLGGLLAAYELSGEKALLMKAKEVGEMLYHAFDTPNHMPVTRWNFEKAKKGEPQVADETVLVAEIGSLTMEFTRLSQLTEDPRWYDAITRIMAIFDKQQSQTKLPGMWPITVNARKADFTSDTAFTLAAMSDSLYEYLPKTYALLGGRDTVYKKLYKGSMETAIKHTLFRPMTPDDADILVSGFVRTDGDSTTLYPELQHLVCFAGGMFALGGKMFQLEEHVTIGKKLTDACTWAYKALPHGIMPEISHLVPCDSTSSCPWDNAKWKAALERTTDATVEKDPLLKLAKERLPKGFTAIDDKRYVLRPEAIESVFYLYRITGLQRYQDAAWDMFTAIRNATETDLANAALSDISIPDSAPHKVDSMESFWMAETLKYFYLIFSEPDLISLDDYVLNTEAHPLRVPQQPTSNQELAA